MADSSPLDNLDDVDAPSPSPSRPVPAAVAPPATRADLERLYRSHSDKLLGYFRRCGLNEAVARELVQESFVQALRALRQFDGRAQLSTWVWAIARNQMLAHLRQLGQRPPPAGDAAEPLDADSLTSPRSGHQMERDACVRRAFAEFSRHHPERAQVLYLAVVEGWTREELAGFLGRSVHAATEYLSQCRARFKPFLARCDDRT